MSTSCQSRPDLDLLGPMTNGGLSCIFPLTQYDYSAARLGPWPAYSYVMTSYSFMTHAPHSLSHPFLFIVLTLQIAPLDLSFVWFWGSTNMVRALVHVQPVLVYIPTAHLYFPLSFEITGSPLLSPSTKPLVFRYPLVSLSLTPLWIPSQLHCCVLWSLTSSLEGLV